MKYFTRDMLKDLSIIAASCLLTVYLMMLLTTELFDVAPSFFPDEQKTLPPLVPSETTGVKYGALIRMHEQKTGMFICSASVISKNYAVTAAHCLYGRTLFKNNLIIKDERETEGVNIPVQPVYREGRSDLGLISGDFSAFEALPITTDPTTIWKSFLTNEAVLVTCGFPYGGHAFCAPFFKAWVHNFGFEGHTLLYPGMSGGPVMNSNGVLVAVNSYVDNELGYVSPVINLLRAAKVEGQ